MAIINFLECATLTNYKWVLYTSLTSPVSFVIPQRNGGLVGLGGEIRTKNHESGARGSRHLLRLLYHAPQNELYHFDAVNEVGASWSLNQE